MKNKEFKTRPAKTVQGMTKEAYILEHKTELILRWADMDSIERQLIRQEAARLHRKIIQQMQANNKPPIVEPVKEPEIITEYKPLLLDKPVREYRFDRQQVIDWFEQNGPVTTSQFAKQRKLRGCVARHQIVSIAKDGGLVVVGKDHNANIYATPNSPDALAAQADPSLTLTMFDRVCLYVKQQGTVTNVQIAKALGFSTTDQAAVYTGRLRQRGRLTLVSVNPDGSHVYSVTKATEAA